VECPKRESITATVRKEDTRWWDDEPLDYRKPLRHKLHNKPHSLAWGRKPQWRKTRRIRKRFVSQSKLNLCNT
jgi:hypothetical protein